MNEEKHVPTIDELIELPRPGDAQIAPDGARVAYVVRTPDWEKNEYTSQIWLVETAPAQARPRQLTFARPLNDGVQSSTSPRWSPGGQWLAFLSKREGDEHVQIYRMSPFGGAGGRTARGTGITQLGGLHRQDGGTPRVADLFGLSARCSGSGRQRDRRTSRDS